MFIRISFFISFLVLFLGLCISTYANDTRKRIPLSKEGKKSVIAVLESNEKLHAAFFSYEGEVVEKQAIELKAKIEKIKDKDISKLLAFAKSKLSEIKSINKREINNEHYHIVSSALIYIINKYKVGPGYNAYSCPMVNKKWVQDSSKKEKVHNPYAANMPHCGSKDSEY